MRKEVEKARNSWGIKSSVYDVGMRMCFLVINSRDHYPISKTDISLHHGAFDNIRFFAMFQFNFQTKCF